MIVSRYLIKKLLVIVCVCMIVLLISKKQEFTENEASIVGEPPPPLELPLSRKLKVNIVKISDFGFSLYSILLPLKCRNLIVGLILAAGL